MADDNIKVRDDGYVAGGLDVDHWLSIRARIIRDIETSKYLQELYNDDPEHEPGALRICDLPTSLSTEPEVVQNTTFDCYSVRGDGVRQELKAPPSSKPTQYITLKDMKEEMDKL